MAVDPPAPAGQQEGEQTIGFHRLLLFAESRASKTGITGQEYNFGPKGW